MRDIKRCEPLRFRIAFICYRSDNPPSTVHQRGDLSDLGERVLGPTNGHRDHPSLFIHTRPDASFKPFNMANLDATSVLFWTHVHHQDLYGTIHSFHASLFIFMRWGCPSQSIRPTVFQSSILDISSSLESSWLLLLSSLSLPGPSLRDKVPSSPSTRPNLYRDCPHLGIGSSLPHSSLLSSSIDDGIHFKSLNPTDPIAIFVLVWTWLILGVYTAPSVLYRLQATGLRVQLQLRVLYPSSWMSSRPVSTARGNPTIRSDEGAHES